MQGETHAGDGCVSLDAGHYVFWPLRRPARSPVSSAASFFRAEASRVAVINPMISGRPSAIV
ncbi:Hypothetical protein GbCGDNIH1_7016 [Granulibacter bethesdensis CGDNIH1]|uniref:Uncharacterized protein n=1 Tax=Granulibacter bethesdensis (strain ATCC BAA-1260 / CGDNIH1) TaxID=391165 RepID=A0A286M2U9_GRABC|nr:Hypothetical protein GbCGDNIH5_7016 [Granulibacter bethesdensis]APH63640.1 Hypothetical protein GbCGDNIH1I4_7016 [Granulibacter bethesdensis]ASV62348.1 Hypothetical protein GbCGDNIH1_7016 [Granulibacter bethesdensis CGDNIH1]